MTSGSAPAPAHPTLVVVPVYGDLPSLLGCVASLRAHLDTSVHRVLLVNDCGPDADAIETALLDAIDGVDGFRYERNASNLGFVGTCNRAVTELDRSDLDVLLLNSDTVVTAGFLDELSAVLYADDSHGTVCARSNNATIASLPFRLTESSGERTIERTTSVYEAISPLLPRWYVSPVAMGFCFLTRRELIERFGLFDEVFAPGYGEENDYCLRLDAAGFSSLIANRALVFHESGASFVGARRTTLRAQHQKILDERYPFYGAATGSFLRFGVSPADRLADVLVPRDDSPRLAVDLRGRSLVGADLAWALETVAPLTADFAVEVVVDQADEAAASEAAARAAAALAAAALAAAPELRIRTDAHPDDIVPLTLVLDGATDADRLVETNRRSGAWVVLAVPDAAEPRWAERAPRAAQLQAAEAARAHALAVLTPGQVAGLAEVHRRHLARPLTDRVRELDDRWSRILLAEAVSERSSIDDAAALRRARDELRAIKQSRSYRLGNSAVVVAKKLLRRP